MRNLLHLANNHIIQDWVKLPTPQEMDLFRKKELEFKCKQKLIITSKTWENKEVNLKRKEGVR